MEINNIPPSMARTPQWICWKLESKQEGARPTKIPKSPKNGYTCSKTDETEYVTLKEALIGRERHELDGIGFVFANGFVAIDLDDCFDEEGSLTPTAQNIVDHFPNVYWEYSPSGNGLHGFMRGEKPNDRTKNTAERIEVYSGLNYVTVTGDIVPEMGTEATEAQAELDWLFDMYLPPMVQAKHSTEVDHGDMSPSEWLTTALTRDNRLNDLYNDTSHEDDESAHDMALATKLAYWLNRDHDAIEEAFLKSPWVSSKSRDHAKKLQRKDYLPQTISKAINMCSTTAAEKDKSYKERAFRFLSPVPQADGTETFPLEDYTDLGNALCMAKAFGDMLCYTSAWGWCVWNGQVWETDVEWAAMNCARDMVTAMMKHAKDWKNRVYALLEAEEIDPTSDVGKARLLPSNELYKHAVKSQSERSMSAMLKLNKSFMVASADQFDANPWLLNTQDGVVDLKTGELNAHDAKYRMTRITDYGVSDEKAPMFNAFLHKIFCDDDDLIRYVQMQLGTSLVGKVYSENLIIANGTGSNGKSTLFNTMLGLLGNYGTAINPELLMSGRTETQQVGAAMLAGKRLGIAQETEEGEHFRSSQIKRLVSTDSFVAKKLYKDPHEVKPTHTLILSTNFLPRINSTDKGTWRRITVVPFNAELKDKEVITDYHSVLLEHEGNAILKWAIDGAVAFSKNGCSMIQKPQAVEDASKDYRENEDWLAWFLADCTYEIDDKEAYVSHTDLYNTYMSWTRTNGEFQRKSKEFGKALQMCGLSGKQKHYDKNLGRAIKVWYGIALVNGGSHLSLVKKESA